MFLGYFGVGGRGGQGVVAAVALVLGELVEAGAGAGGAVEVLAGQAAHAEGAVVEAGHVFAQADFGHADFKAAAEQAVGVLGADGAGQTVGVGQVEQAHQAPGGFVADAPVADLTGLDEVGHIMKQFQKVVFPLVVADGVDAALAEEIGFAGGPVELVEVDVVGLEAVQALAQGFV